MARVNKTTGLFLIFVVVVLVGSIAGVQIYEKQSAGQGNAPEIRVPGEHDVFCQGWASVFTRKSHPTAALPPGFAALVKSVEVRPLQKVTAGQVLLRLDDTMANAQLEKAKAAHEAAKLKVASAKELVKEHQSKINQLKSAINIANGLVDAATANLNETKKKQQGLGGAEEAVRAAEAQLSNAKEGVLLKKEELRWLESVDSSVAVREAEAGVTVMQKTVDEAEALVKQLVVKAPGNGVIVELNVSAGEQLGMAGPFAAPQITFLPDDPIIVRAEVNQDLVRRVKEGMEVTLRLHSSSDATVWKGKVEQVAPVVSRPRGSASQPDQAFDPNIRECIIRLDAGHELLVDGTRMSVQIHVK